MCEKQVLVKIYIWVPFGPFLTEKGNFCAKNNILIDFDESHHPGIQCNVVLVIYVIYSDIAISLNT